MSQRRPWTQEEDKQIIRLMKINCIGETHDKLKWNDIAKQLKKIHSSSRRTGKQCRQRWHNQLDPQVKHVSQWSQDQIKILFIQQQNHGNRWAQIAKHLKGRTDNNVKNFFYSTLRRGIRRINTYITKVQRKKILRKQFNHNILSKLLAVADEKYKSKLDVKKQRDLVSLAKDIRNNLLDLSQKQIDEDQQTVYCNTKEKQKLIENILQFNRNCKRKKTSRKKTDSDEQDQEKQQHIPKKSKSKYQSKFEIISQEENQEYSIQSEEQYKVKAVDNNQNKSQRSKLVRAGSKQISLRSLKNKEQYQPIKLSLEPVNRMVTYAKNKQQQVINRHFPYRGVSLNSQFSLPSLHSYSNHGKSLARGGSMSSMNYYFDFAYQNNPPIGIFASEIASPALTTKIFDNGRQTTSPLCGLLFNQADIGNDYQMGINTPNSTNRIKRSSTIPQKMELFDFGSPSSLISPGAGRVNRKSSIYDK